WGPLAVVRLGFARNVPSPTPRSTVIVLSVLFVTARSILPSLFRSAATIELGPLPTAGRFVAAVNVPFPTPKAVLTDLSVLFSSEKSAIPSPLKSATPIEIGPARPTGGEGVG